MKNLLKKRIKELNTTIINTAFDLKKHEQDDLARIDNKFDWAKGECLGIKGTYINKDGSIAFKI